MYILALSLDWFTTIPGIMISLGVVLLIIALILFIVGSKKAKTEKKEVNTQVDTPVVDTVSDSQVVTPIEDVQVNTVEVEPEVVQEPKFEDVQIGTPGVDPINLEVETTVSTNELPVVEDVQPVASEISIEMPEVKLDETMVSVYGGESPATSIESTVEEPKVTIYGGNDPLDATQNLPKVDEHYEPYSGASSEVKIVEPVEENVIEIPEVEPIQIAVPEVEEQPISIEIPAEMPVEAPIEIPSEPVVITSEPVEIPTVVPEVTVDTTSQEEKPVVEEL